MPVLLRFVLAAAGAAAMLAVIRALEGPFGGIFFSMPIAAVALLALWLGAGPGLLAMVLMGGTAWYFFLPPSHSLAMSNDVEVARLVAYFIASSLVLAAVRLRDRTRRRLATAKRQAERALTEQRKQAQRLSTLTDNSPEVIARFDRQLRHTFLNAYGAKVCGVPVAQALGKTNAEMGMPADKVAFWNERFEQVFATGQQQTVDFEFDSPNLGHQYFSSLFVPERDEAGQIASILAITRDVTDQKRAEGALRRAEELRRLALKGAELGSWEHDVRTGEISLDERAQAIYAVNASRMQYADALKSRLHPDDQADFEENVRRNFRPSPDAATQLIAIRYRIVWPDGSIHWVEVKGEIFFEGEGDRRIPVRSVGTVADITELKKAEDALRASEKRFRELADAMPQVVSTARPDGVMDYVNERVQELAGARRREDGTWDWGWERALHADDLQPMADAWTEAIRTGKPFEMTHRLKRADGSMHWYLSRAVPVRDAEGRIVRWYGTATDIDAQKKAEQALREADRRKNDFLAMLSHELRNPLAPIRNSLYVLERATPGGEQARRARDVIDRQVVHMTRLIEDLLDLTRISRGKVHLQVETLELCDLVRRTAEDHRSLFASNGVQFDVSLCEGPLFMEGDPTRLSQVVGNLLGNAVKFTPRGGHVRLSLSAGGGTAEIRMRDDGAGLSPQLLDRLFEPFVQADSTLDRSKGGLGLGLALVKALAELHGGTVSARSEGPGKGAEFIVRLPVRHAGALRGAAVARREGGAKKRLHVLLIEDNVDSAESLKEALELNGHHVEIAGTGQEGIDKAHRIHPDVVLCDIGLPGIDGFEVARRMRADPELHAAPLVALSGYAAPEDLERSKEAGFNQHLAKPPDVAVLDRTLSEVSAAGHEVAARGAPAHS